MWEKKGFFAFKKLVRNQLCSTVDSFDTVDIFLISIIIIRKTHV